MDSVNRRRYDMLVRVRAFCGDHRDLFEGTPLGATILTALDKSVSEVSDAFAMQSAGRAAAREATTSRRTARAAVRRSLVSIRRTSRFLGLETAGLDDRFPLPRDASDRELVADARAVAQNAIPLTDRFVAHGLPPGVLRELPEQIQALERTILDRTAGKELHVGAYAAATAAVRSGAAAADELESIILNAPPLDPETQATWRNARRVGPAHLKEAAAVAAVPAPQPTPSSSTQGPEVPSKAA